MTVENGELITVGEEEYVQMPRSKLVAFKLKLDTMRPYGRYDVTVFCSSAPC